jgi:hypothetical protein
LTNGTVSAANFSPAGVRGGEADGAIVGAATGVAGGEGVAAARWKAAASRLDPSRISILVKYRKPATPIATKHTTVTATGHIQFGPAGAAGGFLNCGVA